MLYNSEPPKIRKVKKKKKVRNMSSISFSLVFFSNIIMESFFLLVLTCETCFRILSEFRSATHAVRSSKHRFIGQGTYKVPLE